MRCASWGRSYQTISKDSDASDESVEGTVSRVGHFPVPAPRCKVWRYREEWLSKIAQVGVRRRAELLYQQLDGFAGFAAQLLRPEFLAESRKHKAAKTAAPDSLHWSDSSRPLNRADANPGTGSEAKRQLWTYSGLGIETRDRRSTALSADNCNAPRNPNSSVV